jgi:hypothetical protein
VKVWIKRKSKTSWKSVTRDRQESTLPYDRVLYVIS